MMTMITMTTTTTMRTAGEWYVNVRWKFSVDQIWSTKYKLRQILKHRKINTSTSILTNWNYKTKNKKQKYSKDKVNINKNYFWIRCMDIFYLMMADNKFTYTINVILVLNSVLCYIYIKLSLSIYISLYWREHSKFLENSNDGMIVLKSFEMFQIQRLIPIVISIRFLDNLVDAFGNWFVYWSETKRNQSINLCVLVKIRKG